MKQFDLEQSIMNCWNVIGDMELLANNFDTMHDDEAMNYLIGMKAIYDQKFSVLWKNFEEFLKEYYRLRAIAIKGGHTEEVINDPPF